MGRAHLDRRGLGFVPWGDTLRQMHEQTQASSGSHVGCKYMAQPLHRTAKPHQGPPMCTCSTTTPLEQVTGRKGRQIGANMQCRMIVFASVHVYCWWHVALGDFALRRDGTHIRGASQSFALPACDRSVVLFAALKLGRQPHHRDGFVLRFFRGSAKLRRDQRIVP